MGQMFKKKKKILIYSSILVVAVAIAAIVILKSSSQIVDREETLKPRDLRIEFREVGWIYPRSRVEIKSPFSGIIERICVNECEAVKKGQTVVWMSSSEKVAIIDSATAVNKAEYEKWQDIYKSTPVIAHMNGFVLQRYKKPGQTVNSGEVILAIADDLIVYANIHETDLRHIKIGNEISMYLDAYPGLEFRGTIEHVSYEAEFINNVAVYEVRIKPVKRLEIFRSGMSVTVTIPIAYKKDALSIPIDFITEKGQAQLVTVKTGDRRKPFDIREVRTGMSDGIFTEIVYGLLPGETVVTFKSKDNLKAK